MARGAGSDNDVASPTFTLNRQYKTKDFNISHFDFYRLDDPGIMSDQLAESLGSGDVVVVEWADLVKDVLPPERLSVELTPSLRSTDTRDIIISYPPSMTGLITKLKTDWQVSEP